MAEVQSPEGPLLIVNWHLGWPSASDIGRPIICSAITCFSIEWAAGANRGRLQRLAQYASRRSIRSPRFRAGRHAPSRFRSFPAYLAIGSLDKAFIRGKVSIRQAGGSSVQRG